MDRLTHTGAAGVVFLLLEPASPLDWEQQINVCFVATVRHKKSFLKHLFPESWALSKLIQCFWEIKKTYWFCFLLLSLLLLLSASTKHSWTFSLWKIAGSSVTVTLPYWSCGVIQLQYLINTWCWYRCTLIENLQPVRLTLSCGLICLFSLNKEELEWHAKQHIQMEKSFSFS